MGDLVDYLTPVDGVECVAYGQCLTAQREAALRAENEELRAALAPFAAEGDDLTEYADSRADWLVLHYLDPWHEKAAFTIGDVRRAAALLRDKDGEDDG